MANSPEFLSLIALSIVILSIGGGLTIIGALAYRRKRTRSLFAATVGFALLTLGMLIEGVYEVGFKRPPFITGIELLRLQLFERVVMIVGIGALIYSLVRY